MKRYRATVEVSTGHTAGSKSEDWTVYTITKTVEAPDRKMASNAIEAFAREHQLGPIMERDDTRIWTDITYLNEVKK